MSPWLGEFVVQLAPLAFILQRKDLISVFFLLANLWKSLGVSLLAYPFSLLSLHWQEFVIMKFQLPLLE